MMSPGRAGLTSPGPGMGSPSHVGSIMGANPFGEAIYSSPGRGRRSTDNGAVGGDDGSSGGPGSTASPRASSRGVSRGTRGRGRGEVKAEVANLDEVLRQSYEAHAPVVHPFSGLSLEQVHEREKRASIVLRRNLARLARRRMGGDAPEEGALDASTPLADAVEKAADRNGITLSALDAEPEVLSHPALRAGTWPRR